MNHVAKEPRCGTRYIVETRCTFDELSIESFIACQGIARVTKSSEARSLLSKVLNPLSNQSRFNEKSARSQRQQHRHVGGEEEEEEGGEGRAQSRGATGKTQG